jgi:8-oxo-dGTP pyrophosphatase MutT (NUDIX family)
MMSEYLRGIRAKVGHELLLLPSVTVLVFDAERRVLLLHHGDTGKWVAPGGMVEPDETPEAAAFRELREETGLEASALRMLGAFGGPEFRVRYANGDQVAYVMSVYEAEGARGEPRADGIEIVETRYCTREDVDALEIADWLRVVMDAVMARE